jgi:hypothetical protein
MAGKWAVTVDFSRKPSKYFGRDLKSSGKAADLL